MTRTLAEAELGVTRRSARALGRGRAEELEERGLGPVPWQPLSERSSRCAISSRERDPAPRSRCPRAELRRLKVRVGEAGIRPGAARTLRALQHGHEQAEQEPEPSRMTIRSALSVRRAVAPRCRYGRAAALVARRGGAPDVVTKRRSYLAAMARSRRQVATHWAPPSGIRARARAPLQPARARDGARAPVRLPRGLHRGRGVACAERRGQRSSLIEDESVRGSTARSRIRGRPGRATLSRSSTWTTRERRSG